MLPFKMTNQNELWGAIIAIFGLSAVAMYSARRIPKLFFVRRPVIVLLAIFLSLLILGASGTVQGFSQTFLWLFLTAFVAYFWFICYAIVDQRSKSPASTWVQWGSFHPVWAANSTVPYGKGANYLRKIEAKESFDLAVTQIKGVKLIAWIWVIQAIFFPFNYLANNILQIPTAEVAFGHQMAARPDPWYVCWASIVYSFFQMVVGATIWYNSYIAIGRIAGYRLLRNTYRPLSSKTIAEFWNRYYYYFKEVLVDFFFYPTFLRYFKKHKRLRLFFAAFMAAGVGNFILQTMREYRFLAEMGFVKGIAGFQSFAFYCIVLGSAIGISQIRSHRKQEGWIRGQLAPSFVVILFFCLLEPFMYVYSPYPLKEHFVFFLRLFGFPWN
jgi:hypothetical protein